MAVSRLLVLVVLLAVCTVHAYDWSPVREVLNDQIELGAFPGCVAAVATKDGVIFAEGFGNFTYGAPAPVTNTNPPTAVNTMFDMASCTKVVATTTAVMQFYQRGQLDLNTKISDPSLLGSDFAGQGKADISVLNCLLHNSGFPPDPSPNYWEAPFGCPETQKYHPLENFSCRARIYWGLMNQTLENPIGAVYVYSDLNFITLMNVVGKLAFVNAEVSESDLLPACVAAGPVGIWQCYYEAYIRLHVLAPMNMRDSGFLPPANKWGHCAPCENDTVYLHRVIQGQVSDGNAYSMGGIAGHAGLFSTALDVMQLMTHMMWATPTDPYLNRTTIDLFTKEYNHSQSSRALGWNTNDPTVFDEGWNQTCGDLSPQTYMHLGYTGTQICADPVHEVITVFLTNRVYPTQLNTKIMQARQQFNTAVVKMLGLTPRQATDVIHVQARATE